MGWVEECTEKCKQIKHISKKFAWEEKPNRSSYLVASSSLIDSSGSVIKDLYLAGEYRPLRKGRGEIYTIALQYYWQPGELRRVFMIETYPSYMISHRDQTVGQIYGPHLHLGDHRLDQVVKKLHAPSDGLPFAYWAKRFVRHARVYSQGGLSIPGPFPDDIFG